MTTERGFTGVFEPAAERDADQQPSSIERLDCLQAGSGSQRQTGRLHAHTGWHEVEGVHLACHGHIHNIHHLRAQLCLPPDAPLQSVLVAAWRRWSLDFPPRLDGIFALAIFDADGLLLYRDRSGLANLYFHIAPDGAVAFSNHLAKLLQIPKVESRVARYSLHEYLRFLDIAAPHTLFKNVLAVEPGEMLRWTRGGVAARFTPSGAALAQSVGSLGDASQVLDALLQGSVRTRLKGSSRPAVFLSGGIDSALICAIASRHRRDTTALTVGFEGEAYDEAPMAGRIAAQLGAPHQVLRFSRQEYLTALERLSQGLEQPMADPAAPATLLAFEYCRERFDLVLDGTGADEAAGAMPPRHVRLAVEYGSLLPPVLRRGLVRAMRAVPGLTGYTPILDFEHPADTMIRWCGLTRPEIEALCGEPVSFADTAFYRTFARFPREAHFERYSALLDTMPSDRLSQSALITGMTVRYPFFDAQTNRFLRQLRTDWRYLPGQPKRILRALLARYVPAQIWDGPKHGFDFPLQQFLAGDDYALVRKYLVQGRWLDRGLLRPDGVRSYARQFMAGDQRLTFRVWALVMLGAWLEQHEDLR